ncbi:hypothetical protein GQE99_18150 [Maritimibacter sp. DP07]|uniref:Uncharacterized protein n=1 Tax=Maritimibacter harenae TaxID=2606218 RepID=A0A845M882_9RHOB|nr:hypothetical protein [Maritimibacter harenae]MZR14948.1 hypothetical protein [Maritimibacter harenae]
MSRTIFFAIASAAIAMSCIAALMVMTGRWEQVRGTPLTADVVLNEVAVPSDYNIDPVVISKELVARMQNRSQNDLALNILLGDEGNALLRDRAVPRLVNPGVVRRMVQEMEGLGSVIAFADYHSYGRVTVTNRSDTALEDVAMTLPTALRAERDGERLALGEHDDALASVTLGRMEPGAAQTISVWFAADPGVISGRASDMRVGADAGVRGAVRTYQASTRWNGSELQVRPWARWLVAGMLTAVTVAALAALALLLVTAIRRARVSRA